MVLQKVPKNQKRAHSVRFEIETRSSNKNNAENNSVYGRNDDFRLFLKQFAESYRLQPAVRPKSGSSWVPWALYSVAKCGPSSPQQNKPDRQCVDYWPKPPRWPGKPTSCRL
jgi:hypothetical protein